MQGQWRRPCSPGKQSQAKSFDFRQPLHAKTHPNSSHAWNKTRAEELKAGGKQNMLWTLFVILLVLWLLGMVTSYTLGGFVHILLVLAVIALIFQLLTGRRPIV
jgi:Flp pilus assembly protein TadB